jgi:hypothetical protein
MPQAGAQRLLRLPGLEEAAQAVHYACYSLNTQVATFAEGSGEAGLVQDAVSNIRTANSKTVS